MNITELPEEMLMEIFMYTSLHNWRRTCKAFDCLVRQYRRRMCAHLSVLYDCCIDNAIERGNMESCMFIHRYIDNFTVRNRDILSLYSSMESWQICKILVTKYRRYLSNIRYERICIVETFEYDNDRDVLCIDRRKDMTVVVYTTTDTYVYRINRRRCFPMYIKTWEFLDYNYFLVLTQDDNIDMKNTRRCHRIDTREEVPSLHSIMKHISGDARHIRHIEVINTSHM